MAAFHSCLEILFRPESPEVSLCSLSRAAPSSPSPALAPGTSLPVRRGGRHGGGVAAVCGPGVPVGWLGRFRCPRPASFASTQRAAAPGNKSNGFLQPFPKKRNSRESAQDRCRRCRKSGAWLLSVRRRCCGCPPGSACSSVRCRCRRSGACFLCVGVAGGCRRCRCFLCVARRAPRQPRWRVVVVSACRCFCVSPGPACSGRGGVARNQGEVGQHTGLPLALLPVSLGAATGIARVVGCVRSFCL